MFIFVKTLRPSLIFSESKKHTKAPSGALLEGSLQKIFDNHFNARLQQTL
jgi:hypothetical protein